MRRFIEILALFAAFSASAFNSEAWMAKRELMRQEAERLHSVYSNLVTQVTEPATEVTVPFDTFDDGSIKTMVQAKKAQYFANGGYVWASDVVVRKFDRDGSLAARIDAKACVIDRFTKSGWVEGPARVEQGGTVLYGENVFFSSPEGYVRSERSSRIVSTELKSGGLRP